MVRLSHLSCILFLFVGSISCQTTKYGDNATAGKYYHVRGINLYAETYGSGTPLLLIHGNGGSISAFEHTIPYFSKKYKVIAVDSRAHGKSHDDSDSLSFEEMADDCAALLDSMNLGKADVIGWSDGGIVAIILAMRHPDMLLNIASTGANLSPDSSAIIPSVWEDDERYYAKNSRTTWITQREKNRWKIFMLDWLQPNVPLTELDKVRCPSLIISGDHDLIVLQHTVAIYQHIPHAYLWVLPNSGHGTLIEHSEEFNKKVDDFFQGSFN